MVIHPFSVLRGLQALGVAVGLMLPGGLASAQEPAGWHDLAISGVDAYNRRDFEAAAERFRLALELAQAPEQDVERLVNSNLNLAMTYNALGRHEEAEELYLEAIRLQEAIHGPADPALAVTLSRLAGLYSDRGEWDRAEPLLRRALSVREDAAGLNHPYTALAVEKLGDLMLAQERYREAIVQYERAAVIRTQVFGAGHRSLAHLLTSSGIAYRALKRSGEADSVLLQALAIWQDGTPAPPEELLRTLNEIVSLYTSAERYGEAAAHKAYVVRIRFAQMGENNPAFAAELDLYADLLRRSGAAAEAEVQAARAAEVRARNP